MRHSWRRLRRRARRDGGTAGTRYTGWSRRPPPSISATTASGSSSPNPPNPSPGPGADPSTRARGSTRTTLTTYPPTGSRRLPSGPRGPGPEASGRTNPWRSASTRTWIRRPTCTSSARTGSPARARRLRSACSRSLTRPPSSWCSCGASPPSGSSSSRSSARRCCRTWWRLRTPCCPWASRLSSRRASWRRCGSSGNTLAR
mmetsp:Transcript_13812/g.54748  ORF Transcript_13812/g.54748 Transcript_13812/m.54748 type:complete len:202 (-) Transcript_13812:1152-1757(-)